MRQTALTVPTRRVSVLQLTSMSELDRRAFLGSTVGVALATATKPAGAQPPSIPIVDCHIHLFDQTRPQGAPYSAGPGNTEPALPARYRKLASPLGIVGAIEVEASPWIEDNLWVLEVEQTDRMMVGTIGDLQPDKPEFTEYLDRYRKNRLFLGIRYGNLWGYNLVEKVASPSFSGTCTNWPAGPRFISRFPNSCVSWTAGRQPTRLSINLFSITSSIHSARIN